MIFRVHKSNNFVVMSKSHLRNKDISLKAKGLLSQMLSLPDDWDYSISGLAKINKECEDTIKTVLEELKASKYLIVTKRLPNETKSGRIEYLYDIYEEPYDEKQEGKKQAVEIQAVEIQATVSSAQLNNNILNNKELNNKYKREIYKEKNFSPPSLEEIENYIKEKNLYINAKDFYDYFEEGNWIDSRGNKVKNWKQKIQTWARYNTSNKMTIQEKIDRSMEEFLNANR